MVNDLEHFHFDVKVKKKPSLNKNAFSSRIRTARLFTVSRSTRRGGVCPQGGCLPRGGWVSTWGKEGFCPGGVCPWGGVSAHGEGCLPRGGGVCLGGVCQRNAGIHPPSKWTEFLTHACENITFPQLLLRAVIINFAGNIPHKMIQKCYCSYRFLVDYSKCYIK